MYVKITPAVKSIMIACFVAFMIQQTSDRFFDTNLLGWFGLVPKTFILNHRIWQLFTYPFLHGDVMHLVLNLLMLAFIGGELEGTWGTPRFLRYYFFCSSVAGLLYLILQMGIWGGAGLEMPMVGASGAIYGLLMAYGLIFGERVLLFMMLFPMKAKHFIWILAGVEFMSTVFSGRGGLASAAHLGGMAAGFSFLWGRATWVVLNKRRAQGDPAKKAKKAKKRQSSKHLKLVIDNEKEPGPEADDVDDTPKTLH